jgi:hypothetical protein
MITDDEFQITLTPGGRSLIKYPGIFLGGLLKIQKRKASGRIAGLGAEV